MTVVSRLYTTTVFGAALILAGLILWPPSHPLDIQSITVEDGNVEFKRSVSRTHVSNVHVEVQHKGNTVCVGTGRYLYTDQENEVKNYPLLDWIGTERTGACQFETGESYTMNTYYYLDVPPYSEEEDETEFVY